MTSHKSTVWIKSIEERDADRRAYRRAPSRNNRLNTWPDGSITSQFRFIVRLAWACHERGVPYDLTWRINQPEPDSKLASEPARAVRMRATITASGDVPVPKALPKPPKSKPVSDWKPRIWDAVYTLGAYFDARSKSKLPGFVIDHSSGLSLVHPSESGELGVMPNGENEDIRAGWLVTHTKSGLGSGFALNFQRAASVLLLAASEPVDWTLDLDSLKSDPAFRRAGNVVIAAYGSKHDREIAREKLNALK